MSVLRQRVISGTTLAIGVVGLVLLDGWLSANVACSWQVGGVNIGAFLCNGLAITLVVSILSALVVSEVVGFVRHAGFQPNRAVVHVFSAGFVIGPYLSFNLQQQAGWHDESWGILWVSLALGLAFLLQAIRRGTEKATVNVATAVFIIVYAGGLAGYLVRLRMEVGGWEGAIVLLFSVLLVKINDIGAFFTGRTFGKHKLIPWLSPKKTWEGFVGGIVVTVLCAVGVGTWLHHAGALTLPGRVLGWPWDLVFLGLLMALFSVAGDLVASLLKRDADVKDSGQVIPGMGGVLDVLDSPLLAAPVAWFFWTRLV